MHRRPSIEQLESRRMLAHTELVRNGAFESVNSPAEWNIVGNWLIGTGSHDHGGTQYAYLTNASGSAANNLSGTLYQQLSIPANTVNPTLTFWTKITTTETTTTQQRDVMNVQVQNAAGTAVLQQIVSLSNLNSVTTSGPHTASGKYTLHTVALSQSLIGQTVRVAFIASTDSANPTIFRVDDVGLSEPIPVKPGTRGQIVGYLPSYRQSLFAQMDLDQLTWINYFSISAGDSGALTTSGVSNTNLATVVNAAHARGLGVSITVGPQSFATMAADPVARAAFALNIKNYLVARNLDAVDIDWEPPGNGVDQVNYGLLIHDLYAQLNPIGKKITAAVNPWTKEIPVAATQMMDWVNVMTYDFDYANHSTYAAATDGMNQWFNYGVAKDKLMMGIPFYARSGTSWSNTTSRTYGAIVADYRSMNGVYPPDSVTSYVDSTGATYFFNGVSTTQQKVNFVRDNGFAGAMIWEIGQDHWESGNYTQYSLLPVVGSIRRPDAPSTPALALGNDSGISPTDRVTNIAAPSFSGTAEPNATITLYSGGVARGTGVANAAGAWTVAISSPLANGAHTVTAVASNLNGTSPVSTSISITIDTAPPVQTAAEFQFLSAQLARFAFSENLVATFTLDDLTLTNLTTGATIPPADMSLQQVGNEFRVTFASAPGGVLPDGNYLATISPTGVTDPAGNALGAAPLEFFVFAGDANRDRAVDITDFAVLAGRFNLPGNFSQGDFNYDGTADIADFSILAAKFNTSLPAPFAPRAPIGGRASESSQQAFSPARNDILFPASEELS